MTRNAGTHPLARDPSCMDRCVDLSVSRWALAGPRHRCGRPPSIPLSRGTEDATRRTEVPQDRTGSQRRCPVCERPATPRFAGGVSTVRSRSRWRSGSSTRDRSVWAPRRMPATTARLLATIRRGHVRIEGSRITFDFTAKSGKRRVQTIADAAYPGSSARRAVTAVVKGVAEHLGNTPAVCRASYIDPG